MYMAELLLDALIDGAIDTLKIIPFLFVTYLLMEYLEHRTGDKTLALVRRAGRLGPMFGGVLGIIPQCGFSAAASGLYAGRVITAGTLIAVFLSTSDEMLPILISSHASPGLIASIVLRKALIGILFGFVIDFLFRKLNQRVIGSSIRDICEHEHCHCNEDTNILHSALRHTASITLFLFLISVLLNIVIGAAGEEALGNLVLNKPVIGQILAALIGLIPNCAASVVITQLYLEGAMGFGAMMAGLLVGAGVGLLVLFRTNRDLKENLQLTGILYVCGVLGGLLAELL